MTTYETALFLTAGIVSGIFPFILSAALLNKSDSGRVSL